MATVPPRSSTSRWLTRPPFFKAHSTLVFQEHELWLFLDIDQKDQLISVRVEGPFEAGEPYFEWRESFELACSFCEGLSAHEALKIKFHSLLKTLSDEKKQQTLFHPFALLLRKALVDYWGIVEATHELQGNPFHELICRCFGVYRSDLVKHILENPQVTAAELSTLSQAGMGCTSCLGDLSDVIQVTRDRFDLVHTKLGAFEKDGSYIRPLGLTPMECLFRLEEALQTWIKEHQKTLVITDIRGYEVELSGEATKQDLKDLMSFWEQKLGGRFTATLLV